MPCDMEPSPQTLKFQIRDRNRRVQIYHAVDFHTRALTLEETAPRIDAKVYVTSRYS